MKTKTTNKMMAKAMSLTPTKKVNDVTDRSRFAPSYWPRLDELIAGGLPEAAACELLFAEVKAGIHYTGSIGKKITASLAGRQAAPVAKAVAPSTKPKAAAAPAPKARTIDELQARVQELQQIARTQALVAAHNRGELSVADSQSAEFSARLDQAFGSEEQTELGVVFNPQTGLQSFNVPVATTARKQAAPAKQAASYSAPTPAPVPGMPAELASRIEAAFSDNKPPADSVRMIGNRQVFGGRL